MEFTPVTTKLTVTPAAATELVVTVAVTVWTVPTSLVARAGVNAPDAPGGGKVTSGNAVPIKYAVMPLAPVTLLVSTATDLANTNCPVYVLDACNVPAVITNDVTAPFNALVSLKSGVESTVLPNTSSNSSITQSPAPPPEVFHWRVKSWLALIAWPAL